MPDISKEDARPLDIPIPLVSGGRATLRIPVPLSEEDYEILTSLLDVNLKGMKRAIVREEPSGMPPTLPGVDPADSHL